MTRDRLLLIPLLIWGLVMVAPDLLAVVKPIGSFGFYVNNDGVIYDVIGPFPNDASSPAWKAGLREGDQVDLSRLRCPLTNLDACGNAVGALGGLQFVLPGRKVTVDTVATPGRPAREFTIVAEQRPSNFLVRTVGFLDAVAGILIVTAAGWLVWTRPSAMTWGFFLYVNWFNPGQAYVYYAILQQWPAATIAQDIAGCVAQAAGYVGLLLFVIRAPNNKTEPMWRPVERALPLLGLVFAVALIASYAALIGYPTELLTRGGILAGFAVAVAAVAILVIRKRHQKPEDYQRLRWVLWGCLIGLPSFLIADLATLTTFFENWTNFTPTDDISGLIYLLNGVLCLFVFEAVRRERVVSVWIPLRRVTILTFILTPAALLLHQQVERIEEHLRLPTWAWLAVAVIVSFAITLLHDRAVGLADSFFNRWLDRVEHELGQAIRGARTPTEIEQVLADGAFHSLALTSAASFRHQGSVLRRDGNGKGWDDCQQELRPEEPLLAPLQQGEPFKVKPAHTGGLKFPSGLCHPVLAVPAINPARCFAVSLYGPHASGNDLDHNERAMLARVSHDAAAIYAELESKALRERVASLEHDLEAARRNVAPQGQEA
jgi:hypothetical protein